MALGCQQGFSLNPWRQLLGKQIFPLIIKHFRQAWVVLKRKRNCKASLLFQHIFPNINQASFQQIIIFWTRMFNSVTWFSYSYHKYSRVKLKSIHVEQSIFCTRKRCNVHIDAKFAHLSWQTSSIKLHVLYGRQGHRQMVLMTYSNTIIQVNW